MNFSLLQKPISETASCQLINDLSMALVDHCPTKKVFLAVDPQHPWMTKMHY
jgi:hypothetical protein